MIGALCPPCFNREHGIASDCYHGDCACPECNTPAAIRQSIGQTHYSVTCDQCHGRRYLDGILCGKCDGGGRILIPERRAGERSFLDLFKRFRSK
jgi:DnaJ-class molecular chaperone